MAKRPGVSPSTRACVERKLAGVDARRSNPPSAADIARILAEMQSPDEQTRVHAVEQACPCQVPLDTFHLLRKAAQRLRKDPNPVVHGTALHVEEDAREIEALEALRERITEQEEGPDEIWHRPPKKRERASGPERPRDSFVLKTPGYRRRGEMPTAIARDEVRRLLTEGAQLVDVLPAQEYQDLHLPGAISIPLKELTAASTAQLRKDRAVIVYCHDYQ